MSSQPINSQNKWPLGFCDCFSYKNSKTGDCKWCPFFLPMGLCGTCCLVGRIRTLYINEPEQCCGMGNQGLGLCCISTPINIFGPLGGYCWFALNGLKARHDVAIQYGINDKETCGCCCNCWTGICTTIWFPCNLFQVLMTLEEFHARNITPVVDMWDNGSKNKNNNNNSHINNDNSSSSSSGPVPSAPEYNPDTAAPVIATPVAISYGSDVQAVKY